MPSPRRLALGVVVLDQACVAVALYAGQGPASTRLAGFVPVLPGLALGCLCLLLLRRLLPGSCYLPAQALLAGGLASNALTYVLRGGFVDYLPLAVSRVNLADVAIVAGLSWMAAGTWSSR